MRWKKHGIRIFGFIASYIGFVVKNSSSDIFPLLVSQSSLKRIWRQKKGIIGWSLLYTGNKAMFLKYCYSWSSIRVTVSESLLVFEITASCDPILINTALKMDQNRKEEFWGYFGSIERWYSGNHLHGKRIFRYKVLSCIYALHRRHIFQEPCLVIPNIH